MMNCFRLKRDAIANDIALGAFDPTLEKYQFRASAIAPTAIPPKKAKQKYTLGKLWDKFTEFQSHQLETTTIKGNYHAIARCIKHSFTQKSPKLIVQIFEFLLLKCYSLISEIQSKKGL
ncbi:MAG: hypothetical protein RMX68_015330 [Aulosira sp. ZfuVER01]|nr:hypothetical protein [Aulosira sp. ZfuVER01]MDZ7998181.1 hypothetical protein [Aulosira sp. DedVER01a]MDZ8052817.1 hypothetical protein [Aulosira sp. ZfuCHP01]